MMQNLPFFKISHVQQGYCLQVIITDFIASWIFFFVWHGFLIASELFYYDVCYCFVQ